MVNLLVLAGASSFFFSHRMWFYFKSMILKSEGDTDGQTEANIAKEQYKRTRVALNGIKESCCDRACTERLYLSNSQEIVALLRDLKLIDRYPLLVGSEGMGGVMQVPTQRQTKVAQIISDYCEGIKTPETQQRIDRVKISA